MAVMAVPQNGGCAVAQRVSPRTGLPILTEAIFACRECHRLSERKYAQFPSFAIRRVSRDTLRLADFLWMIPVRAARMRAGSAATRADFAAALLPLAIASSTLRSEVRMRERRALFTSVRRAILRVAFLADLVLAISVPGLRPDRE